MIGVANTFARIGAGFLADLPCIDPLVLNIGALCIGNLIATDTFGCLDQLCSIPGLEFFFYLFMYYLSTVFSVLSAPGAVEIEKYHFDLLICDLFLTKLFYFPRDQLN